jgi:hypothetical protein
LLERVALLPIGEPPRPQVRPADKPYSIAFLCSYACGTNSLSRIYVRASHSYLVEMAREPSEAG